MKKINWKKTLGEVLNTKTEEVERISPKTGNSYTTEVVAELSTRSIGTSEKRVNNNGEVKYRYSVVYKDMELEISVPNKVDVEFGTPLLFKQVSGGQIGNSNNGWFSAESVEMSKG